MKIFAHLDAERQDEDVGEAGNGGRADRAHDADRGSPVGPLRLFRQVGRRLMVKRRKVSDEKSRVSKARAVLSMRESRVSDERSRVSDERRSVNDESEAELMMREAGLVMRKCRGSDKRKKVGLAECKSKMRIRVSDERRNW